MGLSFEVLLFICFNAAAILTSLWWKWAWTWRGMVASEAGLLLLVWVQTNRRAFKFLSRYLGIPTAERFDATNVAGIQFGSSGPYEGVAASLVSSWCCIPHPAKAHRGGEDAVFVTPFSVGCADGVGGWAARGVDSGLYSRSLMQGSQRAAIACCERIRAVAQKLHGMEPGEAAEERNKLGLIMQTQLDPIAVMQEGFDTACRARLIGSTTACIISFLPFDLVQPAATSENKLAGNKEAAGTILTGNLGDSGAMVVREGRVVLRTVEQTHAFNFPRQLGTGSQDMPRDGDRLSIRVQDGDLLVVGTDGLFDNMFDHEILDFVVQHCNPQTNQLSGAAGGPEPCLARELALAAYERAVDRTRVSPFVRRGVEAGCLDGAKVANGMHCGGKMDDITCIISSVRVVGGSSGGASLEPD